METKVQGAIVSSHGFAQGRALGVFVSTPVRTVDPAISPSNEVYALTVDHARIDPYPISQVDRFDVLKAAERALSSDGDFADSASCQVLVLFDKSLSAPVIVKRFGDFNASVDAAANEVVAEMVRSAMTGYEPGSFDLGAGGARLAGAAKSAVAKVADDLEEASRRYAEEADAVLPKGEIVETGPGACENDVEQYAELLLAKTNGSRFRGVVIETKDGEVTSRRRFSAWPFGKWLKDEAEVLEGKIARDYGLQDALLCVVIDAATGEYALVRFDAQNGIRIVGYAAMREWAWESMSFRERYDLTFFSLTVAANIGS